MPVEYREISKIHLYYSDLNCSLVLDLMYKGHLSERLHFNNIEISKPKLFRKVKNGRALNPESTVFESRLIIMDNLSKIPSYPVTFRKQLEISMSITDIFLKVQADIQQVFLHKMLYIADYQTIKKI